MPEREVVILIRGINVGAHARLAMADLRELAAPCGLADVRTVLQSGNLVGTSDRAESDLVRDLEAHLAQAVPARPRVVLRTAAELAAVADEDPFGAEPVPPSRRLVAFLAQLPPEAAVNALAAKLGPRERMVSSGAHIHLLLPDGLTGSGLARINFDTALGTTATLRNRATVTRIAAQLGRA